ncbi:hypothetical protein [Amycolatopsis vastitatis]|uniref:hypothetical protein n=1 Tax=Amycolatopsis vastitatis TaxID=1905142 RepID=UPI001178CDAD|nr:hypothetical protein [Amycolatopsis vastitatis]
MRGDVGCPVCGSPDFSCGMATSTTGVDERIEEAPSMAELREYRVTVNGHDTIMNLTEADAELLVGVPVALVIADDQSAPPGAEPKSTEAKRREVADKRRSAQNKS